MLRRIVLLFFYSLAFVPWDAVANNVNSNSIMIPQFFVEYFSGEGENLAIFPNHFSVNFIVGRSYQLYELGTNKHLGSATIQSIFSLDLSTKKKPVGIFPSGFSLGGKKKKEIINSLRFFYSTPENVSEAILVNFERINLINPMPVWQKTSLRRNLPFAKTITRSQMRAMMAKNSILLDVRAPGDIEKLMIPRSTRLPYLAKLPRSVAGGYSFNIRKTTNLMMRRDFFQNKNLFLNFKQQQLKQPNRNVIVTCLNEIDFTCVRALTWMHFNGLKNLYWYRGGAFNWFSYLSVPPATSIPQVKSAGIELVENFKKHHQAIFLYVNKPQSYALAHIPGSINLPYKESFKPLYHKINYPKTKRELIKSGDFFNIRPLNTKNKNTPIIVYSYDEYRWDAFKASIWLRDSGFKNVYFYRQGLAAWMMKGNKIASRTSPK